MADIIYSNLKDQATFIAIRKNASSSIGHAIFKYENGYWYDRDINSSNVYKYDLNIPNNLNDYKFTCLREPFEKLVSGFIHKVIMHPHIEAKDYFDKNPNNRSMIHNMPKYFDSFVSYIELTGVENVDVHFKLQYECARFNKILYNKIILLENIKNDWKSLQKDIIGLPDLPNAKVHSTPAKEYYSMLRPKFISRIKKIYEKDYEIYNSFKNLQGAL
jgi:hypothetical protein